MFSGSLTHTSTAAAPCLPVPPGAALVGARQRHDRVPGVLGAVPRQDYRGGAGGARERWRRRGRAQAERQSQASHSSSGGGSGQQEAWQAAGGRKRGGQATGGQDSAGRGQAAGQAAATSSAYVGRATRRGVGQDQHCRQGPLGTAGLAGGGARRASASGAPDLPWGSVESSCFLAAFQKCVGQCVRPSARACQCAHCRASQVVRSHSKRGDAPSARTRAGIAATSYSGTPKRGGQDFSACCCCAEGTGRRVG